MVAKKLANKKKVSQRKIKKEGGAVSPLIQASGPDVAIAPPSYNAGLYTGIPFAGPWGNVPVAPTTTNHINNNLKSANPPPGGDVSYPGTQRLGNNYQAMPGVEPYQSTSKVNWGPFKINATTGTATIGGGKKSLRKLKRKKAKKNSSNSLKKKKVSIRRRMMKVF